MAMDKNSKIYVAGQETMLGTALSRQLDRQGYTQVIASQEPSLADPPLVKAFFDKETPEYVFLVAGKTGGILANQKYPASLMLDNLQAECSVLEAAYRSGVKKLLYLASSCVYPRDCSQPMRVESLLTGPLEPTNESYALAKIAGIKLCEAYRKQFGSDFVSGIPANPFGPGEDFSLEDSHVIPALMRKMHAAKVRRARWVEVWGTGKAKREFVYVEDLADACVFVMQHYSGDQPINMGSGEALSIGELALVLKEVVGFTGELRFDTSKPDGMPKKLLDSDQLLTLGWRPRTTLQSSLAATYAWFLQQADARQVETAHV